MKDIEVSKNYSSLVSNVGLLLENARKEAYRQFFLTFPKWQTVSAELGWSQYIEIIKLDNEQRFTSEYKLYLPDRAELQKRLSEIIN